MSDKRIKIPTFFSEGQLSPQEERLAVRQKPNKLFIGIPKETTFQEKRVPLVPSSVYTLVSNGHRVVIEAGAGEKSNFSDHAYSEAGAEISYSKESVFKSDVLIKIAPPTRAEIDMLHPGQIIISPLHLPTMNADYINQLRQKRVIALAMEYIQDDNGTFPLVRIMSEMAGISAMLTAAELLASTNKGGRGVLLAGISGVPPAKVVILGAGVVAEFATRTALGLGAEVRIFDDNVYKLMRIQNQVGHQLYTSTLNPVYIKRELLTADVAIGAIHSEIGRTPCVISEEMVMNMKAGAVIVDVSIDQGGCFATSEICTHDNPTFIKHDIIHYCVPNIASKVARTASAATSNIITSLLQKTQHTGSIERLIYDHLGLRHGVYLYKGILTNRYLGERFQIKTTDINLLLASSL